MGKELIKAKNIQEKLKHSDMVKLGLNVKLMRNMMSMKAFEVASMLGISSANLSKLEGGYYRHTPKDKFLQGYKKFVNEFTLWLKNELVIAHERVKEADQYVSSLEFLIESFGEQQWNLQLEIVY